MSIAGEVYFEQGVRIRNLEDRLAKAEKLLRWASEHMRFADHTGGYCGDCGVDLQRECQPGCSALEWANETRAFLGPTGDAR